MNTLDGKEIMVWTFMGNARMYQALRDYGDRISQIGLFSFKVWCCIIKVDTLFSRILIYNHNQYENGRKTYGTESKIL